MKTIIGLIGLVLLSHTLSAQSVNIKDIGNLKNVYQLNGTGYNWENHESSPFLTYVGKDPYTENKIRRLCTYGTFGFTGSENTTGVYISKIEIEFEGKPWNETSGSVDLRLKINNENEFDSPYWDDLYNNCDDFFYLTNLRKNGTQTILRSQISSYLLNKFEDKPFAEWAIAIVNNDESEKNNGVIISRFSIKIEYYLTYQLKIDIKSNETIYFPTSGGFLFNDEQINYNQSPIIRYCIADGTISVHPDYLIFKNLQGPPTVNDTLAFSDLKLTSGQNTTQSEDLHFSFLKSPQTETVVLNFKPVKSLRAYNENLKGSGFQNLTNSSLEILKNGFHVSYIPSGGKIKVPTDKLITVKTLFSKGPLQFPAPINSPVFDQQNWNGNLNNYQYSIDFTPNSSSPTVTTQKAQIIELSKQTLNVSLDGIVQSYLGVQLKDPWKVVDGFRPWNWEPFNRPFTPGSGDDAGYGGLFKSVEYNADYPLKAHYRLKTSDLNSINGIECFFSFWGGTGGYVYNPTSLETPVRFDAANAVVTANYKGHLRTGVPAQSNAINQTRLIKNQLNDSKLLVYESMGEVWLTGYSPASNTWFPEFRLSSGNGTAKNPSFSNVLYLGAYPNTTTYLTVAFVDNGKIMVQPMQLQADWGFFSVDYLHWNSINNIRELLDLTSKTTVSVVGDSRPVIQLLSSGSYGLKIWWANETTNQGLASGYLDLTTTLASGITAGTAQALSGGLYYTEVSSNSTDQYPVFITYPAAFGQPAKQLIYYLGTGYAAGKRIVEYNVSNGTKTVLSAPSGDYSYSSLSGAANYQSASYVLTATAVVPGQSTTTYNTNIYTKPTYYSGVSLSKVYTGKVNSSVSVQNMAYNGAPTYEVNLVTNSVWEKGNGGATLTQVTTGAQGVFVPANVEINQRPAMLTKSDASGPSKLQFYNGATVLNKGESVLYADVRSVRNYVTLNGQSKTAILDFAGALVEPVDSLENGSSICAVKLIAPDQNTIIVRQPDSIKTALAIDLIRNGVSVRSYSASLWDELSINSFEDVQDGDVLVFRLGFPVASSWGYEIYDFNGTSLTKNEEEAADAVKLKKLENGVAVYPNPFNPNTSISVSLETPASVKVMVFNILGQLVSDFGKADLGAGVHNYAFDGKSLASGTYFYRVEIGDKVKTGKLQLLK